MAQVESRARATSDPEARREALKRLQEENVDFLLLWFTDIEGHLKSFAVTPSEVEEALNDGMGFDGSSITGQSNAVGQAAGGPVLGVIGNVWGIRAALTAGALAIGPALGLYGRAIAHEGREPELAEIPASAVVD